MKNTIKIPDGYRIIGYYGRNSGYVYLKPIGRSKDVATPFCLNDPSFNINLPSQLSLGQVEAR